MPSIDLPVKEATFVDAAGWDRWAVDFRNMSGCDLYIWAYIFDPEDYSIAVGSISAG